MYLHLHYQLNNMIQNYVQHDPKKIYTSININRWYYGGYLNCETQSLDSELIDSYRSFVNSEDADIWSTSDDINW